MLGYLTTVTNVASCAIMFMVIRHAYNLTKQVEDFFTNLKDERQLNTLVTAIHVTIILSNTVAAFMLDNVFKIFTQSSWRVYASVLLLTALQDIFLSTNMFFLLDEGSIPDVVSTGEFSYPVLDVLKPDASMASSEDRSITTSINDSDEQDRQHYISKRMVDQFLEQRGIKEDFTFKYSISDFGTQKPERWSGDSSAN